MKQRFLNTFVVMCSIFASSATYAQPKCGEYKAVTQGLITEYGEAFVLGWIAEENIYEFWASDEQRTWTILRHAPDNTTCMMSAGEDFVMAIPDIPGEDL